MLKYMILPLLIFTSSLFGAEETGVQKTLRELDNGWIRSRAEPAFYHLYSRFSESLDKRELVGHLKEIDRKKILTHIWEQIKISRWRYDIEHLLARAKLLLQIRHPNTASKALRTLRFDDQISDLSILHAIVDLTPQGLKVIDHIPETDLNLPILPKLGPANELQARAILNIPDCTGQQARDTMEFSETLLQKMVDREFSFEEAAALHSHGIQGEKFMKEIPKLKSNDPKINLFNELMNSDLRELFVFWASKVSAEKALGLYKLGVGDHDSTFTPSAVKSLIKQLHQSTKAIKTDEDMTAYFERFCKIKRPHQLMILDFLTTHQRREIDKIWPTCAGTLTPTAASELAKLIKSYPVFIAQHTDFFPTVCQLENKIQMRIAGELLVQGNGAWESHRETLKDLGALGKTERRFFLEFIKNDGKPFLQEHSLPELQGVVNTAREELFYFLHGNNLDRSWMARFKEAPKAVLSKIVKWLKEQYTSTSPAPEMLETLRTINTLQKWSYFLELQQQDTPIHETLNLLYNSGGKARVIEDSLDLIRQSKNPEKMKTLLATDEFTPLQHQLLKFWIQTDDTSWVQLEKLPHVGSEYHLVFIKHALLRDLNVEAARAIDPRKDASGAVMLMTLNALNRLSTQELRTEALENFRTNQKTGIKKWAKSMDAWDAYQDAVLDFLALKEPSTQPRVRNPLPVKVPTEWKDKVRGHPESERIKAELRNFKTCETCGSLVENYESCPGCLIPSCHSCQDWKHRGPCSTDGTRPFHPVPSEDWPGMKNFQRDATNVCFLNATLKMLMKLATEVPEFRNLVEPNRLRQQPKEPDNVFEMRQNLAQHLQQFLHFGPQGIDTGDANDKLIQEFTRKLEALRKEQNVRRGEEFGHRQSDPEEFLSYLFEQLEIGGDHVVKMTEFLMSQKNVDEKDRFRRPVMIEQRLTPEEEGYGDPDVKQTTKIPLVQPTPFLYALIDEETTSVSKGIRSYYARSDSDGPVDIEAGYRVRVARESILANAPESLFVLIKRWNDRARKDSTGISIDPITLIQHDPDQDYRPINTLHYVPKATVNHLGGGMGGGHYTAAILEGDKIVWHDDRTIHPSSRKKRQVIGFTHHSFLPFSLAKQRRHAMSRRPQYAYRPSPQEELLESQAYLILYVLDRTEPIRDGERGLIQLHRFEGKPEEAKAELERIEQEKAAQERAVFEQELTQWLPTPTWEPEHRSRQQSDYHRQGTVFPRQEGGYPRRAPQQEPQTRWEHDREEAAKRRRQTQTTRQLLERHFHKAHRDAKRAREGIPLKHTTRIRMSKGPRFWTLPGRSVTFYLNSYYTQTSGQTTQLPTYQTRR